MAFKITLGPEYFPNVSTDKAVGLGDLYVGEVDTDPEVVGNQIQVSALQEDGSTVTISQPISLSAGGIPLYNGSPVTLSAASNYSLKVLDSSGVQVYYVPSSIDKDLSDSFVFISEYSNDLGDAITGIGADNVTLVIDTALTLDDGETVTVPDNVSLFFTRDGSVDGVVGGSTETLVVNGDLIAGEHSIFGTNLTVDINGIWEIIPEWSTTFSQIVTAAPSGSTFNLNGSYDVANYGTLAISDKVINIQGTTGAEQGTMVGSILVNSGVDVVDTPSLKLDGGTTRIDRAFIKDISIQHEGGTTYAAEIDWAPFTQLENVNIDCNSLGYGGVLFGDELATPTSQGYLGKLDTCRISNHTDYGVRVNSTGSQWDFRNCFVSSTVNGAHGAYINKEGVSITGGSWGANNTGGIPIYFYNTGAADVPGNVCRDMVFENVAAGEYGIVIDGDTRAWVGTQIENIRANFNVSVVGTLVKFGRAKKCRLEMPQIDNPTSGGTIAEWGANSQDCMLICDAETATAPVTVNGSAVRATKIVKGKVSRTEVANITTDSNLTTILEDGVVDLPPGFVPVHNGTAWNFDFMALADDTADSYTPPTAMGIVEIINDDEITTFGRAAYDTATPATEIQGGGADFEVTTGALNGTTGTNSKLTFSAHTDGKIYVEARKGASNITVLFTSVEYGL